MADTDSPKNRDAECDHTSALERRVDNHARQLTDLKKMIEVNNANTQEILEIVGLGRAFFKVLGFIGKPVLMVVLTISAIMTWWKTGSFQELIKVLQGAVK